MTAVHNTPYISPEEYLQAEQIRESKSEYYDGAIVAMSGVSPAHNDITVNLIVELRPGVRSSNCRLYTGDMRVHVPKCNHYYYPDISIACGAPMFQQLAGVKTLENPVVIVEVLSPSTELLDRGDKFTCLQTIDWLQTYVLVSQDRPHIEWFTRQDSGEWFYDTVEGLDSVLEFPSIGCRVSLADIYAQVEFATL